MTRHAAHPLRTPSATWLGLACFGVAVAVAALIGGLGVAGAAAEYQSLDQTAWALPSWLFGPVWTVPVIRSPSVAGSGRHAATTSRGDTAMPPTMTGSIS